MVALPMLRQGDCSRCGGCCTPDPSLGDARFTTAQLNAPGRVEGFCPLFRRETDGSATCLGHGWHPFYLAGCNQHPTQPEDIVATPSCSYVFAEAG